MPDYYRKKVDSDVPMYSKRFYVDDATPTVSQQVCGQMHVKNHELENHPGICSLKPALRCPNCAGVVLDVLPESLTCRVASPGGKFVEKALPPCPVSDIHVLMVQYNARPCGCHIDVGWAGDYVAELHRRQHSEPPRPVILNEARRQIELGKLENNLSRLLSARAQHLSDSEQREAIDYWTVILVDQIQRLCPGKHNLSLSSLTPAVQTWGVTNNMLTMNAANTVNVGAINEWTDAYGPQTKMPKGLGTALKPADVLDTGIQKLVDLMCDAHGVPAHIYNPPKQKTVAEVINTRDSEALPRGYVEAALHFLRASPVTSMALVDSSVCANAELQEKGDVRDAITSNLSAYLSGVTSPISPHRLTDESWQFLNAFQWFYVTKQPPAAVAPAEPEPSIKHLKRRRNIKFLGEQP